MTKLDAAEELAKAARIAVEAWVDCSSDPMPFAALARAVNIFRNAKDWQLLEGEETRIQCLRCLADCDLDNDDCPKCGNEFDGVDEYRDHAPFIDFGDIDL